MNVQNKNKKNHSKYNMSRNTKEIKNQRNNLEKDHKKKQAKIEILVMVMRTSVLKQEEKSQLN